MTFGDGKLMKENEMTIVGKSLFTLVQQLVNSSPLLSII